VEDGTRGLLLTLAGRMDEVARRRREYLEMTYAHGLSLLNDIEANAEEIAASLRLYCANNLVAPQWPREG
jgi:hypothetical protein